MAALSQLPRIVCSSAAGVPKSGFATTNANTVRGRLLLALSQQAASGARRGVEWLFTESIKYVTSSSSSNNRMLDPPKNVEEALMTVPDLETIPLKLVKRTAGYDIREMESYVVAETKVADGGGGRGFGFLESGQAFNTLAAYLFGKNSKNEAMEMTTPVLMSRNNNNTGLGRGWKMAFVIPSKYSEETLGMPQDSAVTINRAPPRLAAVVSFAGYVTDEVVKAKEDELRKRLLADPSFRVAPSARAIVAQYNPPFTPPLFRRNEVMLEVEAIP